jgi:hypothetical protein
MRAPRSLAQAALNRVVARVGSGLADTAASLAVLAQDAPSRLRDELLLFWEEVEREAERIERSDAGGGAPASAAGAAGAGTAPSPAHGKSDPQELIDALRARVAGFSRRLDERPEGTR